MKPIQLRKVFYNKLLPVGGQKNKYSATHVWEELYDFSYEFEFGKAYLLRGSSGDGAWALSWILGGLVACGSGKICSDDKLVTPSDLRAHSWIVRSDEIKRFGFMRQSVQTQIQQGLKKNGELLGISENQIIQEFDLTPERYDRLVTQLSHEAWRASPAIGLVHGKRIMCFPQMSPIRHTYASYIRLKEIFEFLKSFGVMIIFPYDGTDYLEGTFDEIIDLKTIPEW